MLKSVIIILFVRLSVTVTGGDRQSDDEAQLFIHADGLKKKNLTVFLPRYVRVMPADKHVRAFLPQQ